MLAIAVERERILLSHLQPAEVDMFREFLVKLMEALPELEEYDDRSVGGARSGSKTSEFVYRLTRGNDA
jgi:hypothetical protein